MNQLRKWKEQNAAAWPGYDWKESSWRKHRSKNGAVAGDSSAADVSLAGFLVTREEGRRQRGKDDPNGP